MKALSTRTSASFATRLFNFLLIHSSLVLLSALSSGSLQAQATVKTDLPDYPPGATVYIAGSGFQPRELVTPQADGAGNVSSTCATRSG